MSDYKGGLPPPPGVIPNFEHPQDVVRRVNLVTQALSIPIVSSFVMLRIFARYRISRAYRPDDLTPAQPDKKRQGSDHGDDSFSSLDAAPVESEPLWGGYHQWEVREHQVVSVLRTAYVSTIFYAPMAFFVKVALLSILISVFTPYKKTVKLIYLFLGLLLAYYIPALIIKIRIACRFRLTGRGMTVAPASTRVPSSRQIPS